MLRTRIIQDSAGLDGVRSLWDELAKGSGIFQSFQWNRLAAECFEQREHPYVVCCESDSGMAILPAVIRQSGAIGFVGETLFDYRDVLAVGDKTVLAHAWQELCKLGRAVSLTALRGEETLGRWLKATPKLFTFAPCVRHAEFSCLQFLQMQPRLGRHSRRILKSGIRLRRRFGDERELVRFVYERKGAQAGADNLFRDPQRREFMVRIAAEQAQRCEIFTYETANELVAALVTFRHESTRHFYTIYYDPKWSGLSPGQVLLFEATALSLAEGLDCDYMTGESPYKLRLATSRVPLFTVDLSAAELRRMAGLAEDAEKIA